MIIIEIESTNVSTKAGTKNGKNWRMDYQQVAIAGTHVDGFPTKYPRESSIQLEGENPQPYPPGKYVIAAESFYFGDFGRLTLGRVKLQPLATFLADIQKQFAKAA
jgi:hypothetical protein